MYSKTAAELFWQPSETGTVASGYEIRRDDFVIGTTSGTSFFDEGLSENQRYEYRVTAFNESGARSLSSNRTAVTPGGPFAPTNLSAAVYGPTVAEIFWDRAMGAAIAHAYEIHRDGELIGESRGTSYMDLTAKPGASYEYRIVSLGYNFTRSVKSAPLSVKFRNN